MPQLSSWGGAESHVHPYRREHDVHHVEAPPRNELRGMEPTSHADGGSRDVVRGAAHFSARASPQTTDTWEQHLMSMLIDENTTFIIQGITGREAIPQPHHEWCGIDDSKDAPAFKLGWS